MRSRGDRVSRKGEMGTDRCRKVPGDLGGVGHLTNPMKPLLVAVEQSPGKLNSGQA